jgi:hypothetical protein
MSTSFPLSPDKWWVQGSCPAEGRTGRLAVVCDLDSQGQACKGLPGEKMQPPKADCIYLAAHLLSPGAMPRARPCSQIYFL